MGEMKFIMMLNRKVKRVPLDFDHPLGKVWSGYLLTNQIEPPEGKGYQCWETTSEGSPISPVFKTFDNLCEWLGNNQKTGITEKFTVDDWKNALKDLCPVVDMATKKLELANKKEVIKMKGEDPKEKKEWTLEEKMKNFLAPSLKWKAEQVTAGTVIIYSELLHLEIQKDTVLHITYDPHLKYILLKNGTVITYLPDKDILIIT